MKRRVRGQALLETVLGSIVFVTILLFGILFGEVMVTSMKVTEAAAAPVWDATAGLHHRIPTDYSPAGATLAAARVDASRRYANFDGRSVATGLPGAPATQVLTRARDMTIECRMGNLPAFHGSSNPAHWVLFGGIRGNGGVECNAEAFVAGQGAIQIGSFLEGANGLFQQQQRNGAALGGAGGFKVCALNRPIGLNGACRGRFDMLIDDFGLASASNLGGNEGSQCPSVMYGLPCAAGGNMPFWTATNAAYTASSLLFRTQTNDYINYMRAMFRGPSPDRYSIFPWIPFVSTPVSFHMSFMGEDTLFTALTPWATDPMGSSWIWQGSPFAMPFLVPAVAYANRDGNCYLGRDCGSLP